MEKPKNTAVSTNWKYMTMVIAATPSSSQYRRKRMLKRNVVMALAILVTISEEPLPQVLASMGQSIRKGTKYSGHRRVTMKYTVPATAGMQ